MYHLIHLNRNSVNVESKFKLIILKFNDFMRKEIAGNASNQDQIEINTNKKPPKYCILRSNECSSYLLNTKRPTRLCTANL
jgi:hypothetical protein